MSTVTAIGRNTVEAVHSLTQDTSEHEQNAPPVRIPVLLPDMFVSFMAREPRVNPHYEKVREESEAWINRCAFRRVGVPKDVAKQSQQVQLRRADEKEDR